MKLWVVYIDDYEGPYNQTYFRSEENARLFFEEKYKYNRDWDMDEIETED